MALTFSKYEGLGNDFVIVDGRVAELALARKHAVSLCDRHLGIGADGVLLVEHHGSRPAMRVINADGSRPEMCGNGLRCVALHLLRTGAVNETMFEVDTDAGPHLCKVQAQGRSGQIEVSMRAPTLEPQSIPVLAEASVLDQPFEAAGQRVRMTCVSMGNPHAVTFDDVGEARATLGPLLEKHARFPRAANIGFARVVAPQVIDLAVWERGVGFTQACGTGACACAVAAVETGRAQRNQPIEVRLPGGCLQIVVGEAGERLSMRGPARHVFDGSVEP
ncbi:MAG TPA: diaminopimelate epimerase [Polyangiales bacterium]